MAMRVFFRRHSSPSSSLLLASFRLGSLQNVASLVPSFTFVAAPIKRRISNDYRYEATKSRHSLLSPYASSSVDMIRTRKWATSRLFGSPAETNEPGEINLSDERDDIHTIPIDLPALHKTIDTVRDILGYPTYDVSCQLIDEDYMKEINSETRGMEKSTDVLSFCFTECVEPGVLQEIPSHGKFIGEMYCLGDILVCVDYVANRCEEDRKSGITIGKKQDCSIMEGEVVKDSSANSGTEYENSDDKYEYQDIEVEVEDEWDDRGVAPALLSTYDPEIRIHMLIVHGMLHLVGYDHIEDEEYELMVEKEDEVLAELKRRLGDDFGLRRKTLAAGD
jgi:probable rRNA maturation factor